MGTGQRPSAGLGAVAGQVDLALNAVGDEGARYVDRNVRHLLTHLPSRATYEQLLGHSLQN